MKQVFFIALFLICLFRPAAAASIDDAEDILQSGNCKKAFSLIQPLATEGNAEAQRDLGWMYFQGCGVEKSNRQAFDWFSQSAARGNADAQAWLASLYADGLGTKKNLVQSYKWLSIARMSDENDDGRDAELGQHMKDIGKQLSPAELDRAKALANEWRSGDAKPSEGSRSFKLFLSLILLPAFCAAGLPGRQRQFHYFYRIFAWMAFSIIVSAPLFFVMDDGAFSWDGVGAQRALTWALASTVAFFYTGYRCSSIDLSFMDGLMCLPVSTRRISSSLSTALMAIVTIILLMAFIVMSLFMCLFYELTLRSNLPAVQFRKLIQFVLKKEL